jgi:hypothetical protein
MTLFFTGRGHTAEDKENKMCTGSNSERENL